MAGELGEHSGTCKDEAHIGFKGQNREIKLDLVSKRENRIQWRAHGISKYQILI